MGIYTKVADDGGKWVEIGASSGGELPGLGGWATITEVTGVYTPHRYNDGPGGVGGTDWVAYEFTDDGTLQTSGGLVDAFIISAGGGENNTNSKGNGAFPLYGLLPVKTTETVVVGKAVKFYSGGTSLLGNYHGSTVDRDANGVAGASGIGAGAIWTGGNLLGNEVSQGLVCNYTGEDTEYGMGRKRRIELNLGPDKVLPGSAGAEQHNNTWMPGAGVVIVRVPAAYAQGVAENFHGWDSFALVNDGVVTDVTKVPDNEPRTLDAEWVPCSADVQAGWGHVDGEFVSPPAPTRDDLIAELRNQIKNLQKDK